MMGTCPTILVLLPSGTPLIIQLRVMESLALHVDALCRHSEGKMRTDLEWRLDSGTVGEPMDASYINVQYGLLKYCDEANECMLYVYKYM